MANITVKREGALGILTFTRPSQLNAMNTHMMGAIVTAMIKMNKDPNIKVIIITGEGKGFMAGADIKEYADHTSKSFRAFQAKGMEMYKRIESSPKITIAAVNGYALGGGFEVVLSCDIVLAHESASMGLPEVLLHLIPGGGGTQRSIKKLGYNRALDLLITGRKVSARELFSWGFVTHIEERDVLEAAKEYAKSLVKRPLAVLTHIKQLAQVSLYETNMDRGLSMEQQAVCNLYETPEAKARIKAFIEKTT